MLTGQRPDTTGGYNFETENPTTLLNIPMMFSRSGYVTAGYGKVLHLEKNKFRMDWNYEQFNNNWYYVQNNEDRLFMNATVTPDKNIPEEKFPDYIFADRAINTIRNIVKNNSHAQRPKPFMVGLGFKLPHLALHIPFKYFDMYRTKATAPPEQQDIKIWPYHFKSTMELTYPRFASSMGYSMSNYRKFFYMNDEGQKKSVKHSLLQNNELLYFPKKAHLEVCRALIYMLVILYVLDVCLLLRVSS